MRTKDQRKAAERAVLAELKELESRTGCRAMGSVGWNPLRGMYGEVKVFTVENGKVSGSEAHDDVSKAFVAELMPILNRWQCILLPNMQIVNGMSVVTIAVVGQELVGQQVSAPTDDKTHQPGHDAQPSQEDV